MKYFFIISLLLSVTVAQQEPYLRCLYFQSGDVYGCDLSFYNPNGLNNFTEIGGFHLSGFTNADVSVTYTGSGVSTNIPRIICDTFPNVFRIDFYGIGITGIDDSAFIGCSNLAELYLARNRISSVSANAFNNLRAVWYINLQSNLLTTLPENVFANQANVTDLDLSYNPINDIPNGLFGPLVNLENLFISYADLSAINGPLFTTNGRLKNLNLVGNRIAAITTDSFLGLEALVTLNLAENSINEIASGTFANVPNLRYLYLVENNFTELQADSFPDLDQLEVLDISNNPINVINAGAFRGLENLTQLSMVNGRFRQLHSYYFEGLTNLSYIFLDSNEIEDLPVDVFVPMPNLIHVGLWDNRLKSVRRNSFGTLTNLRTFDLDGNIVNALDRALIEEAVNLDILFFFGNLCASNYFGNFANSRDQFMPILDRCFTNMRYIVGVITENDNQHSFFEGPEPGIALRVSTDNEVHIALTPFDFMWNPTIEILIGTANNTMSVIRMNQETNVVTVPTPNIIVQDRWNDFRITWANHNVLVYRGNSNFPFMAFAMQSVYPVNFYGLRALETRASWSVQPFDF